MEQYGDEGFIRLLREGQEEAGNKEIKKGSVMAGGKRLLFTEREILKNRLWMWLPDEFRLMGKEMARIKYPCENRPDVIHTNPETTINVSVSHKTDRLKTGQEEEIRDDMEQIIHNLYPSCPGIRKGSVRSENTFLSWFDIVTPAIDGEIYNLMFFASLKERLLMGTCNCLKEDREEWEGLFLQMLASVRTS